MHNSIELTFSEYYFLHRKLGEILDTVFGGYSVKDNKFVAPDKCLEDLFKDILNKYLKLEYKKGFPELPIVELRTFTTLSEDIENKIYFWANLKGEFAKDELFIENLSNKEYKLPLELEITFHRINFLLDLHNKAKNKLINKVSENTPLPDHFKWDGDKFYISETKYFEIKKLRKQIFKYFTDADGTWVNVTKIASELQKSPSEIYTIIDQINGRIAKEGFHKIMKLETKHEGSYKLSVFIDKLN